MKPSAAMNPSRLTPRRRSARARPLASFREPPTALATARVDVGHLDDLSHGAALVLIDGRTAVLDYFGTVTMTIATARAASRTRQNSASERRTTRFVRWWWTSQAA
jgi:hypothetical protein